MATQLSIINEALRHLGLKALATLSDDVEARYVMMDAWADAVEYVLERGDWRFAVGIVTLAPNTSTVPVPGYAAAFDKPADWLKTVRVYEIVFNEPHDLDFQDYEGRIHANRDEIVLRYLRAGAVDVTTWPAVATKALAVYLAANTAVRLTQSRAAANEFLEQFESDLRTAKFEDAKRERLRFRDRGRFVSSRRMSSSREHG